MVQLLYPRQRTKSVKPCSAKPFMMCQRMGRPPMGIIGLGMSSATSRMRVPWPPHRITTCMPPLLAPALQSLHEGKLIAGAGRGGQGQVEEVRKKACDVKSELRIA